MARTLNGETAKIYQFPVTRRPAAELQRSRLQMAADLVSLPFAKTIYGDAWYHAAAIEEASLEPRKR